MAASPYFQIKKSAIMPWFIWFKAFTSSKPSTPVINFIETFTSNFRTGPSVFIFKLMLSATTMPRRRSCGRLLSKWHFHTLHHACEKLWNKQKTNSACLKFWNRGRNKHPPLCASLRAALPTHHPIIDRKGPWTVASLSAVAVLPFSTSTANPHPSWGTKSTKHYNIF